MKSFGSILHTDFPKFGKNNPNLEITLFLKIFIHLFCANLSNSYDAHNRASFIRNS